METILCSHGNSSVGVGVADSGLVVNDQEDDSFKENGDAYPDNDQTNANHAHQNEVTALRMSLVAMETTLHNREKEIDELKLCHSNEMDNLLLEQEKTRDQLLRDQSIRFTGEINKMKEQLTDHTPSLDEGEREAERMQQLKVALKRIHEDDIEKIHLAHQQEKQLQSEEFDKRHKQLQLTCDERIDSNKKQLEKLANDQIKDIHAQFMTSYNQLMKQKCEADERNKHLQTTQSNIQEEHARMREERALMEKKVKELEENHSVEVDAIKEASSDLERRLKEWKEQASGLQSRIDHQEQQPLERVRLLEEKLREKEQEISAITGDTTTDDLVSRLKQQLVEERELHKTRLAEAEALYHSTLTELESQHTEEVGVLEESLTESSKSQASLEFAEAHMKELQQQLNAYRNQEMNHKTAMEQSELEHTEALERIREVGVAKCNEVTTSYQSQLEQLKETVAELKSCVREKEAELEDRLATAIKENTEQCTATVTSHLTTQHEGEMERVKSHHTTITDQLRVEHAKELSSALQALQERLEKEREEQIQQLHSKHKTTLRASLDTTADESIKMAAVQSEETLKELRRLQETNQKLETELRAKEVDLSISVSELHAEQTAHTTTRHSLEDSTAQYQQVQGEVEQLQTTLATLREESGRRLEESLQQKEDEIATRHAHLTSHQKRITELTEELAQERKISESLKLEVEAMTQNSDTALASNNVELDRVQSQLAEAKERCGSLVKEWEAKEEDQARLRGELNNTQETLANREKEYTQRIHTLEQQLTQTADKLADTSQQLEQTRKQCEETTKDRQQAMAALNTRLEEEGRADQSRQMLLDTIDDLQAANDSTMDELEQLKNKTTLLMEERDQLLTRVNQLQLEVTTPTS